MNIFKFGTISQQFKVGQLTPVEPIQSIGETIYTTPGTFTWVAPEGVTSVSVIAVGPGGISFSSTSSASGSGGGGLGWKNNIPVIPGQSYSVRVGANAINQLEVGTSSFFINEQTVAGFGAQNGGSIIDVNASGGSYIGDGGGNGGTGGNRLGSTTSAPGGGGAGGYSGNGGNGSNTNATSGQFAQNGAGGGGGGGGRAGTGDTGGSGGGVGIFGEGLSGAGGINSGADGGGGAGGSNGQNASSVNIANNINYFNGVTLFLSNFAGKFGGGGSGSDLSTSESTYNGTGVVRIIWGNNRQFPSTNTTYSYNNFTNNLYAASQNTGQIDVNRILRFDITENKMTYLDDYLYRTSFDYIANIVSDSNFLYVLYGNNNLRFSSSRQLLVKYNKFNFEEIDSIQWTKSGSGNILHLAISENYIYTLDRRILKSDFTQFLDYGFGSDNLTKIKIDGTNIYISRVLNNTIYRYDESTFPQVQTQLNVPNLISIETTQNYMYTTTSTAVTQRDKNTLEFTGNIVVTDTNTSNRFWADNDLLYFTTNSTPLRVATENNFTSILTGTEISDTTGTGFNITELISDDNYIYASNNNNLGRIKKIKKSDLTVVAEFINPVNGSRYSITRLAF
jgi:hypothetical protein